MKLNSMHDLLVAELQDLLSAEKQIEMALPKMANAVGCRELKTAIENHLKNSGTQFTRLERCFRDLGLSVQPARSHGMIGLISGWMEVQESDAQKDVRDAAIIASLQHLVHYEIAGYGCARAFAQVLGKEDVSALLGQTLEEEERFDRELTRLALTRVNRSAEMHTH